MLLEKWWAYLLGYIFSVIGGFFLIKLVVDKMWEKLGEKQRLSWLAEAVGFIERVLYTSSWLLGKSEFIAVWLALKVAGQWMGWTDGLTNPANAAANQNDKISGRAIYNIFLIGSGLSISYAVVGAKIIEWLIDQRPIEAIIVPVALLIGTFILWIWVKNQVKSMP